MRKTAFISLALSLITPLAYGQAPSVLLRFEDPCHVGKTLREIPVPRDEKNGTAGDATLTALQTWGVAFEGTREGIQSILQTPTSLDAVVFESDDVFRIHGWCYQVDGVEPGVMAGDFKLSESSRVIRWFFGYARYRGGNWEGYCNTDLSHTEYCKSRLGVRLEGVR